MSEVPLVPHPFLFGLLFVRRLVGRLGLGVAVRFDDFLLLVHAARHHPENRLVLGGA